MRVLAQMLNGEELLGIDLGPHATVAELAAAVRKKGSLNATVALTFLLGDQILEPPVCAHDLEELVQDVDGYEDTCDECGAILRNGNNYYGCMESGCECELYAQCAECYKIKADPKYRIRKSIFKVQNEEDDASKIDDSLANHALLSSCGVEDACSLQVIARQLILAATGAHIDGTVRIWNAETGQCVQVLEGHASPVLDTAWSLDRATLLTSSRDGSAKLWDVLSGTCRHTFRHEGRGAVRAVFSEDCQMVATASGDGTARLWDTASGQCRHVLAGHTDVVHVAVFVLGGTIIATAGEDGSVRMWDVASGACLRTLLGHASAVTAAIRSPDGALLLSVSDDETTRLWDIATGECLHVLTGSANSGAFSPDCALACTYSQDDILVWDVATGCCVHKLTDNDVFNICGAEFSQDGSVLVTTSNTSSKVWKVGTWECVQTCVPVRGEFFDHATLSADGALLLTFSNLGPRVWSVATGEFLQKLDVHKHERHMGSASSGAFA